MSDNKFERVSFNPTIKVRTDSGMSPVRDPKRHEIFLSFYDDSGAEGFRRWWNKEGSEIFNEWYKNNIE